MPFLLLSIPVFMMDSAPLEMPRAEAFLVKEGNALRLEDRYNRMDLWVSQSVVGRWTDDEGREFLLSRLADKPPAADCGVSETRCTAAGRRVPLDRIRANARPPAAFRRAIELLSGTDLTEGRPRAPRQLPHGYRDVDYWQHPTNCQTVVCAFRRESSEDWYLAVWRLFEDDDFAACLELFEDRFLRREFPEFLSSHPDQDSKPSKPPKRPKLPEPSPERELLRADVRHSVAAYADWHFTDSDEFAVVDDLPAREAIVSLTNEFAVMRARYAAAVPTRIDGSNVLCVARIYASRAEYLDALEIDDCTNMAWSAAYWSPMRRELVAYLPENGGEGLLRNVRHEAFHQYLSYAASMIPASPWFNEGYAQYFEDEGSGGSGGLESLGVKSEEEIDRMSAAIPGVLMMDYGQFYEGSDLERRFKYRLAWSVVRFIEKGADEVRQKPFEGLKRRYMDALLETHDMRRATSAAFKDADLLQRFVAEWAKFWKNPQNR